MEQKELRREVVIEKILYPEGYCKFMVDGVMKQDKNPSWLMLLQCILEEYKQHISVSDNAEKNAFIIRFETYTFKIAFDQPTGSLLNVEIDDIQKYVYEVLNEFYEKLTEHLTKSESRTIVLDKLHALIQTTVTEE